MELRIQRVRNVLVYIWKLINNKDGIKKQIRKNRLLILDSGKTDYMRIKLDSNLIAYTMRTLDGLNI